MADFKYNDPETGAEVQGTIPDFALESTMQQILSAINKSFPNKKVAEQNAKDMEELVKITKETTKETKKSQEEADKDREKQLEALKKLAESGAEFTLDQDAVDRYNKRLAMGEKIMTSMYDGVMKVTGALIAGATVIGGFILKEFLSLGNELNDLTAVGVGFVDTARDGQRASQALAELSTKGIDAASYMGQFSNVIATQGLTNVTKMTGAFLDATEGGAALGMSLESVTNMYGEEMAARQRLGALDTSTAASRAALNKQIQTTVTRQTNYTRALGMSRDALVEFADSVLENTPVLTATMIRFSSDVRGSVTAGIRDFASAMGALGGQEGANIANAFTEAASMGAMGFSDEMVGYVRAVPSLAGPMNEYITAIQNGTLSQEEADAMAQDITSSLGNLSQAEKNRIFALARAGDQQAISMAKAVSQFEQSEKRLKDINKGFTMEGVQKGTNVLQTIMKELTGAFDAIKYSFLTGVGKSDDLMKAFGEAKKVITTAIANAFGFDLGGAEGLNDQFMSMGEQLAAKLPKYIEMAANGIASFIEVLPDVVAGAIKVASALGTMIKWMGKLFPLLALGIAALVGFKVISGIGGQLENFKKGLAGMKDGFKGAKDFIGNMFGKKGGGASGATGKTGNALVDKITGKGSPAASGGDMPEIKGGAKNGGILEKIAKGVGKFGNAKVQKGALTILTLGGALVAAGAGFMLFSKVSWSGFFKGITALGALVGITKLLEKSTKSMIKGAAAIAILGVALMPAALGLKMFGDVEWESIAKGGVALLALTGVAMVLGKVLGSLIQGSIAIGILGAALIPFAFALSMVKDVGLDNIAALAVGLGLVAAAAAAMGFALPFILLGSVAIAALGMALIPFAFSMKLIGENIGPFIEGMKMVDEIDVGAWATLAASLIGIAGAMVVLALTTPLMLVVAAGLALMNVVITPLAESMLTASEKIPPFTEAIKDLATIDAGSLLAVAGSLGALGLGFLGLSLGIAPIIAMGVSKDSFAWMQDMTDGLKTLEGVPLDQVRQVGPALLSLAAGLAGLSAGNLISNVLDGLGSLFGGKSPFEKLKELGTVAPDITRMVDALDKMPDAVTKFNDAAKDIDGQNIKDQWTIASDGIFNMVSAVDNLSSALDMLTPEQLMLLSGMQTATMQTAQKVPVVEQTQQMDPNDFSDKENFGQAFAEAREIQGGAGGVFGFQGKEYQTNIKGEAYVNNPERVMREIQPGDMPSTDVQTPDTMLAQNQTEQTDTTTTTGSQAPDTQNSYDVLLALLEATNAQNRLLKQQVSYSRDIKDQV